MVFLLLRHNIFNYGLQSIIKPMRSIFKLAVLSRTSTKFSLGRIVPMFSFSDVAPVKIQAFKYAKRVDLPVEAMMEHYEAILSARSCDSLAALIEHNCQSWTEVHLKTFYQHMRTIRMDPTDEFHRIISPFSIEFLKQFNRDHATTMYEMLRSLVDLKIYNKPLWSALIHKLDTENCYKYIPLKQTAYLLDSILSHSEHQAELNSLTRKLITVTYQQREFYNHFKETRTVMAQVLKKIEGLKLNDLKLEDPSSPQKLH